MHMNEAHSPTSPDLFFAPATYKGLQNFHKYWGKKPSNLMSMLASTLCPAGGHVLDPFVGYGSLARECSSLGLTFTGFDINPTAIRLSTFLASPPPSTSMQSSFRCIEAACREKINHSYYISSTDTVATHYLWEREQLKEIWTSGPKRKRLVSAPDQHDFQLLRSFDGYNAGHIRNVKIFDNSRINANSTLSLKSFFTFRALRNIDVLLTEIHRIDDASLRDAFLLSLTSALGQTSRMVFAISGRGKTRGEESNRIEVGSWVIGYWRPTLHFEINVWNCFERRVRKLLKACTEAESSDAKRGTTLTGNVTLQCGDSAPLLADINDNSIDLVITDPPHGDRIPYLELSELWNAVLQESVDFENEIVISDAKDRCKNPDDYRIRMENIFAHTRRVLKPDGLLIVLFNSRNEADWESMTSMINAATNNHGVKYIGCFDCAYSAGSVVQDNRSGSLKSDFGLVFGKSVADVPTEPKRLMALSKLPAWTTRWPRNEEAA